MREKSQKIKVCTYKITYITYISASYYSRLPKLYLVNAKAKHSYLYGPICKGSNLHIHEYEWKHLKWEENAEK